uniref:hypothetical protein n=1 Tax=Candidatus Protochlamydia sp. W-9 TaxID=1785087 RepID=UPI00096A4CA8
MANKTNRQTESSQNNSQSSNYRKNAQTRYEEKGLHHPMSREEAGRRGAEARWGKEHDEDYDGRRSHRGRSSGDEPMSREEAGRRGAEARWGREHDEDYDGRRSHRGRSS